MPLTAEQAAEMRAQMRAEGRAGRPENAAKIRKALERGELLEVQPPVLEDALPIPPTSGPGSSKEIWVEYAMSESNLDPEVIEAATKTDLITMLRANGVIPQASE